MEPFCNISLSYSLNSLLRGVFSVVLSVSQNWSSPWNFPLIRRKVFTHQEALLVFQLGWKNNEIWELSQEEALAFYKTCMQVKALWKNPLSKEAFMKSQWAREYTDPNEVFDEVIPELMEGIREELELSLNQIPDFATIKAECEKGVEEEMAKEIA